MELKHLGHQVPHVYEGADAGLLDKVPAPEMSMDFTNLLVRIVGDEFTTLCPATGGPDFGEISVSYVPTQWLVESKSFKLYMESYRQHRIFHEAAVRKIGEDLVKLLEPHSLTVLGNFKPRGGWAIQPMFEWNEDVVE